MKTEDCLWLITIFCVANSFNIDIKNTITYSGRDNSFFGYSAVLLDNWVVVGSPRDNITNAPQIKSPGVTYRCPVDFTIQRQQRCLPISIQLPESTQYLQDNQFLGGTMVEGEDNIVICAHLWKYLRDVLVGRFSIPNFQFPAGRCHLLNKNLRTVDTDSSAFAYNFNNRYSMRGFSGSMTNNPKVSLLGAPGLLEIGGFMTYNENGFNYDLYSAGDGEDTKLFREQTYIGYSIATAKFTDISRCRSIPVLLGMPHFSTMAEGHVGCVNIVCDRGTTTQKDIIILKQFLGEQIGSGFGYSITVADYDADGSEDLIVSAPFQWSNRKMPDVGKVFIFLGTGDADFLERVNGTLTSDDMPHGRFGTALVNLGDINGDSIDDLAISAPYEGSGVVYIYNGMSDAVNTRYSQKIYGQNVDPGIRSFGMFVSRSYDMDGNMYPDFAIGSPLSDKITLLRSRPVVTVIPTIEAMPSLIPLNSSRLDCSDDITRTPCTTVKICFSFNGPKIEMINSVSVSYSLYVDTGLTSIRRPSRVHIMHDSTNFNSILMRDNLVVNKDRNMCDLIFVRVKAVNRQFFSSIEEPLTMTMNYSLSPDQTSRQVLPILNPSSVTQLTKEARFQTGCEGSCHPDLEVEIETDQQIVVYRQTTELITTITLVNLDEPAFAPSVVITYTKNTKLLGFRPLLQQNSVGVNCNEGNDNMTVTCTCGNVLFQHQLAKFRLIFDVSSLTLQQGDINATTIPPNIEIVVVGSVPSGEDDDIDNNEAVLQVPVEFQSFVEITGSSSPEQGFVGSTNKLTFTHSYAVYNRGPSVMIASEVFIEIPVKNDKQGNMLNVDFVAVENDNLTTTCSLIRSYGVMQQLNRIPDIIINSPSALTAVKQVICKGRHEDECVVVNCTVSDLGVNEFTSIHVTFEVDASKLRFEEESSVDFITTGFVLPADLDISFRLMNNDTAKVTSAIFPEEITIVVEPINIGIIIGGVIGGLLILAILGLVMWKVGFFNRKKKEVVDDYKRKSNYYERRKTARLEAARSKAMSKVMSRSDEVILHNK